MDLVLNNLLRLICYKTQPTNQQINEAQWIVRNSKICKFYKWYMNKSESFLENAMHGFPWDFEKQTDHLFPARRAGFVLITIIDGI